MTNKSTIELDIISKNIPKPKKKTIEEDEQRPRQIFDLRPNTSQGFSHNENKNNTAVFEEVPLQIKNPKLEKPRVSPCRSLSAKSGNGKQIIIGRNMKVQGEPKLTVSPSIESGRKSSSRIKYSKYDLPRQMHSVKPTPILK